MESGRSWEVGRGGRGGGEGRKGKSFGGGREAEGRGREDLEVTGKITEEGRCEEEE